MKDPIYPGIIIKKLLKEANITQVKACAIMGVNRSYLSIVISRKRNIGPVFCRKLPKVFQSTDYDFWRKLSLNYKYYCDE